MAIPMKGKAKPGKKPGMFQKIVPSPRARERKKLIVAEIHRILGRGFTPMTGDVQIAYTITPRDRRTPDVDAYEKHLLDCLMAAGVYVDDKQVVQVSKERMPTAKHPGGVHVEIWEV